MSLSTAAPLIDAVDARLDALLQDRDVELAALHEDLGTGAQQLRAFLQGGKRLRPQFCWWGWRSGGGRDAVHDCAPVIRVAAALEMLQACALIHDDLIDRSDTRRGRPAMHRAEAKRHADAGWSGDAEHFGVGMALLLGDLALAWSDDEFVEGAAQLGALTRAQPVWRSMRTQVLAGQWLDLQISQRDLHLVDPAAALHTAETVILLKTAGYTVTGPLLLGAALAGAPAPVLAGLQRYGTTIGTAFQLRDDLLGVFGAPEQTGKPAGDDLREGKRTVLLARTRQQLAADGDADALDALQEGVGIVSSAAQVDAMRDIILSTDAPQSIEQQIKDLVARARKEVRSLPVDDTVRAGLDEIADRAAHRTT
ncbi:MAG: polyprenyl synthetase family protein [Nakamurella sp.]